MSKKSETACFICELRFSLEGKACLTATAHYSLLTGKNPCTFAMQGFLLFFLFFCTFQLAAILGTELVRAIGAAQSLIGLLPKSLGIENNAQLPNNKDHHRQGKQAQRVKAAHEDNGREHHQMIPVENAAGGAAAVAHDEPEGAPYKHADKVAHIKGNGNQQQLGLTQHVKEVQQPQHGDERHPDDHDLIGSLGGRAHVRLDSLLIYLLRNGSEAGKEMLMRAQRNIALDRHKLAEHIDKPQYPQQVKY